MSLPAFQSLRPVGMTRAAIGGLGAGRPPHISIAGNSFSVVDSTGNKKQIPPLVVNGKGLVALDVVFIDANPNTSRIYWGRKFGGDADNSPPECFSDNGIAPSNMAQTPQHANCRDCPHAVMGTATTMQGFATTACDTRKKLACVIPGDPDGMVYQFAIGPGSYKGWRTYTNWLAAQRTPAGAQPELFDVVTRCLFESQGKLRFEPVGLVEGTAVEQQIVDAWTKKITPAIVGSTDVPIAGEIAPPTEAPQLAKPVAAPPVPTQAQTPTPEAPKRSPGRPKKAEQAASQPDAGDIPPFLQRAPQSVHAVNAPPAAQPKPQFGLAQPQQPSEEIQKRLDQFFKLPS